MQTTCKSNATNATHAQNLGPKRGGGGEAAAPPFWGAAEGRPPSFVHLLHLLRCFYMLFACFAFVLHFIYILFASLLGMMRQLLRQWLLPRMLWILRQQKMGGAHGPIGPMGPWAHGPMGPLGPWAHVPMGPWAHGPMGPWAPPIFCCGRIHSIFGSSHCRSSCLIIPSSDANKT